MVKLALIALCLGSAAYFLYRYVTDSPRFLVKEIRVEGLVHLEVAEVLHYAGISNNDTMLQIDHGAIQARIESLPYVKSCTVTTIYPSSVVIALEERLPVATLMTGNRTFEIDREGVVLRAMQPREPNIGPLITTSAETNQMYEGMAVQAPGIQKALNLLEVFLHSPLNAALTISEIAVKAENNLVMFCDEIPYEIRWGRLDFAKQVQDFYVLFSELNGELPCQEYVDLRFENDLVCK